VREGNAAYIIEHLFAIVDRQSTLDIITMVQLEIYFLPLLEQSPRGARYLSAALEKDAASFISVVVARYREEHEVTNPSRARAVDLGARRVETAYKILSAWNRYPGIDLPPPACEQTLLTWSHEALRLSAERHRKVVGEIEIARVLARASEMNEDGLWPCQAARELLESGLHGNLEDEIFIAKRNLRGMITRAIGDGGQQERVLAVGLRADARKLRIRWARTAALLDRLAESYERDADAQDAEAKTERRWWGDGR
jgi:hypothetical protein